MENKIPKFKAVDFERNQICEVLSITHSDLNGRNKGDVELFNGHISFHKNYLQQGQSGCALIEFTGIVDGNKEEIYGGDLVEDDYCVYQIEWNQQNTSWCMNPIRPTENNPIEKDDFVVFELNYQNLGNGYFSRKDLKRIGNIYLK